MRDPYRKKQRDLRQIARSNRSIFNLFDKYHPEIKKRHKECWLKYRSEKIWYYFSPEWNDYNNCKNDWATKMAGHWNAIGGSNGCRDCSRQLRTRQKAALSRAFREDDWDNFNLPQMRRVWD